MRGRVENELSGLCPESKYECKQCNTKGTMRAHALADIKMLDMLVRICDYKATWIQNLRAHELTVHMDEKRKASRIQPI